MITYCLIKHIMDDCCYYEDLCMYLMFILLTLSLDILLLFLQPILYLIVKRWQKEND